MKGNITNKIGLFLFCTTFLACSSTIRFSAVQISKKQQYTNITRKSLTPNQEKILIEVDRWIGTPYCYGGESRICVDCSGFVANVFFSLGFVLPRTSNEQSKIGYPIEPKDLDVADLLFFGKRGRVEHVAIYIGNGEMAHSTSSRGVVKEKIKENYFNELVEIRRIFNTESKK